MGARSNRRTLHCTLTVRRDGSTVGLFPLCSWRAMPEEDRESEKLEHMLCRGGCSGKGGIVPKAYLVAKE